MKDGVEVTMSFSLSLNLMDHLKLDTKSGELTFDGQQRVFVTPASEYASILLKLIKTGGMELAKIIMHDAGEAGGRDLARVLKEKLGTDAKPDWFDVCLKLRSSLGYINLLHAKTIIDKDNNYYSAEGSFEASAQAASYLGEFGLSPEPVDWLEMGFASGFMSEIFATNIVFKETKCQAMGHLKCEFKARTKSSWDHI